MMDEEDDRKFCYRVCFAMGKVPEMEYTTGLSIPSITDTDIVHTVKLCVCYYT